MNFAIVLHCPRVKSGIFGQTAKFGQRPCLFHISNSGIKNKSTKQAVKILMRRLSSGFTLFANACLNLPGVRIYPTLPFIPHIPHQESKILGFVKNCKFINPFEIFYDSVTKQVRNSCEYSWDSAGFGLNRHDTVTSSLQCAITYFGNYCKKVKNQSRIS